MSIEALKRIIAARDNYGWSYEADQAINEARAALAAPSAEPVALTDADRHALLKMAAALREGRGALQAADMLDRLATTAQPPAALTAAAGEMPEFNRELSELIVRHGLSDHWAALGDAIRDYTRSCMAAATPDARLPLADEQIVALRRSTDRGAHAPRASDLAFARAIERAHGIAAPRQEQPT